MGDEGIEENEDSEGKFCVAFALLELVDDVKYVAEIGTARFSIPEHWLDFLEEDDDEDEEAKIEEGSINCRNNCGES